MAKHNCSLDAFGQGSCECLREGYRRKGVKIDADTYWAYKKRHDPNAVEWREDLGRYDGPGYYKDRRGSNEIELPIGQSNEPISSKRINKRD